MNGSPGSEAEVQARDIPSKSQHAAPKGLDGMAQPLIAPLEDTGKVLTTAIFAAATPAPVPGKPVVDNPTGPATGPGLVDDDSLQPCKPQPGNPFIPGGNVKQRNNYSTPFDDIKLPYVVSTPFGDVVIKPSDLYDICSESTSFGDAELEPRPTGSRLPKPMSESGRANQSGPPFNPFCLPGDPAPSVPTPPSAHLARFSHYSQPEYQMPASLRQQACQQLLGTIPLPEPGLDAFKLALPSQEWCWEHCYGVNGAIWEGAIASSVPSTCTIWLETGPGNQPFTKLVVGLKKKPNTTRQDMTHAMVIPLLVTWVSIRTWRDGHSWLSMQAGVLAARHQFREGLIPRVMDSLESGSASNDGITGPGDQQKA